MSKGKLIIYNISKKSISILYHFFPRELLREEEERAPCKALEFHVEFPATMTTLGTHMGETL